MAKDTQASLISAARDLMLHQGYGATGINEICREAGVSKGAFYHFFESKEALALAALESFHRQGLEELMSIDVSAAPPEDRLPRFIELVAERAPLLWEQGCLLGGLASEMALSNDTLQRQVARTFDQIAALVRPLAAPFVRSLASKGLSAEAIAEDFLAITEGSIVLSRAHRDPRRIRAALERYAQTLRRLPRR